MSQATKFVLFVITVCGALLAFEYNIEKTDKDKKFIIPIEIQSLYSKTEYSPKVALLEDEYRPQNVITKKEYRPKVTITPIYRKHKYA